MPHFMIAYQFIKTFLGLKKMSIFEEYGAFNTLQYSSYSFNKSLLLPIDMSKNCWKNGEQYRPWWDSKFCGIRSVLLRRVKTV